MRLCGPNPFPRSSLALTAVAVYSFLVTSASSLDQPCDLEVDMQTPLIVKYFPDYKITAVLPANRPRSVVARNRKTDNIVTLDESWVLDTSGPHHYIINRSVSDFIATRDIRVGTGEIAVEIAKLAEDITCSPNTIQVTMFNENNWHLFDSRPYTAPPSPPYHAERWEYRPEKSNGIWIVQVIYHAVGTESIMQPPRYQILLKEGDKFKEIRHVH